MADPTQKALAIPEARIQFLRLYNGAVDELSDDSVPADRRESFNRHREYHEQYTAKWFEDSCRWYGSEAGDWDGVPESRQADALRYFGRKIARHDNRCEFELDLMKIDIAKRIEDAAQDDLDFG